MHDAVVSKIIAASRGSPYDSMASCLSNGAEGVRADETESSAESVKITTQA